MEWNKGLVCVCFVFFWYHTYLSYQRRDKEPFEFVCDHQLPRIAELLPHHTCSFVYYFPCWKRNNYRRHLLHRRHQYAWHRLVLEAMKCWMMKARDETLRTQEILMAVMVMVMVVLIQALMLMLHRRHRYAWHHLVLEETNCWMKQTRGRTLLTLEVTVAVAVAVVVVVAVSVVSVLVKASEMVLLVVLVLLIVLVKAAMLLVVKVIVSLWRDVLIPEIMTPRNQLVTCG